MKIEYEFVHDSNNSKIWIIEKKDKKIIIEYGKKGSKLQKKISSSSLYNSWRKYSVQLEYSAIGKGV